MTVRGGDRGRQTGAGCSARHALFLAGTLTTRRSSYMPIRFRRRNPLQLIRLCALWSLGTRRRYGWVQPYMYYVHFYQTRDNSFSPPTTIRATPNQVCRRKDCHSTLGARLEYYTFLRHLFYLSPGRNLELYSVIFRSPMHCSVATRNPSQS